MRRLRWTVALLAAAALGSGACGSDGPSGPGAFELEVRSTLPSVGAVVLELTGPGLQGVTGQGGTEAYGAGAVSQSQGGTDTWRVVLVNQEPGTLHLSVQVSELGDGAPAAVVIGAVDGDNELAGPLSSFSVEVVGSTR